MSESAFPQVNWYRVPRWEPPPVPVPGTTWERVPVGAFPQVNWYPIARYHPGTTPVPPPGLGGTQWFPGLVETGTGYQSWAEPMTRRRLLIAQARRIGHPLPGGPIGPLDVKNLDVEIPHGQVGWSTVDLDAYYPQTGLLLARAAVEPGVSPAPASARVSLRVLRRSSFRGRVM
jgi:hypothetical protein